MLSRWVPLLKPHLRSRELHFRHSLVRTVLIALLLTSLFPVLLIGTLNLFRSRDMLREQVSQQSETISNHQVKQITEYAEIRATMLDRMVRDENFLLALNTLLNNPASAEESGQARSQISYIFRGNPRTAVDSYFDQMFIIRPNHTIALATDNRWVVEKFGDMRVRDAFIRGLNGTDQSIFVFEPLTGTTSELVLYTTRTFRAADGSPTATLIATHIPRQSDSPYSALIDSGSFLPGAQGLYFTQKGTVIGIGADGWSNLPPDENLRTALVPMAGKLAARKHFPARLNNQAVYVYASWVPQYNLGVMLAVSEATMLGRNTLLDPFNVGLLIASLAISGGLIFLGSTRIVRPLVQLAQAADNFARGKWSARAQVSRDDEIGLLAHSFNRMAEELSSLYQSMESAVESRTTNLRTASEVAQLATTSTRLNETLARTVELINDRFHYYHAAIYLFDGSGERLALREASGIMADLIKRSGDHVNASADTLLSRVARERRAIIVSDVETDPLFRKMDLLPDTRSEAAIPILLGGEVLGVMDLHSTLVEAFNQETVAVFQTLANQISSALQAARLLESTRASFEETTLLYQTARQVTLAQDEAELVSHLSAALLRLPCIGAVLTAEDGSFKFQVVTDANTGRAETGLQSLNIPIGRMGALLEQHAFVLIEDVAHLTEYDNLISFLRRRGGKSAALIPVLKSGRAAMVLVIGPQGAALTDASMQAFATLAEVVGAALAKFEVLKGLNARVSELQVLTRFSEAISAETDLNALYYALHQQVIQTFGAELEFGVAIYNAARNELEFPYFYEKGITSVFPPLLMGEGLTSTVIQSGKALLLKNQQEIRSASPVIDGAVPFSWLGIPLVFAGKSLGAILIQDLYNENRFSQDDVHLFMTLAPQIATAVRNTQLYAEAQEALRAYDQERFLLNTLLENMPEGISFKDTRGQYIRASASAARLYRQPADALIGKTSYDLMDREAADALYHDEQMVMSIGKPEIGLIRGAVAEDGAEQWQHVSRIPVRTANGSPYGLLIIERDITELKRAEALAQRRADQVLTAAEIARDTTGTLDMDELLKKSVNLVRERFGFYHASIFLIDPPGEYAVLRESTGSAGEEMIRRGHRLAVGGKSIVGQVAQSGNSLIVNNVTDDPTHLPNPLLPETRSELAIPLKVGERILGALDVQSTKMDAFNDEDVNVLEILADQMAVAVVNGNLYSQSQQLLDKHRLLRQVTIAASSSTNLEDALHSVVTGLRAANIGERIGVLLSDEQGELHMHASAGYENTRHLELRVAPGQGITGKVMLEKRPVLVNDTLADPHYLKWDEQVRSELAVPILFSDTLMGVLNLESTRPAAFDENDLEILGALGSNLGGVVANIRLINQVRQQVQRERQLFEVTSQIRRTVALDEILETSARELARALGARRASIRITAGRSSGNAPTAAQVDDAAQNAPENGRANGHGANGLRKNGRAHAGEDNA